MRKPIVAAHPNESRGAPWLAEADDRGRQVIAIVRQ